MWREFRDFTMRGNVVDMAVGIIIGTAFGKIVSSLVADVIMPPIGLLLGDVDFNGLFLNLSATPYETLAQAKEAGAPTINYGVFTQTVLDFVLVAFVIFLLIKQMNRLRKPVPVVAPATKECPLCLSVIPIGARRCAHCIADLKPA